MKHIYLISGLGADRRIFKNLDLGHNKLHYIDWMPQQENESIEHYARRMAESITGENPIIIGLSFGGMMAIEISKLLKTEKIILFSSAKTKNEIPLYFRMAAKPELHKKIPFEMMANKILIHWLLGIEGEKEKKIADDYLAHADKELILWSIEKIINWQNTYVPANLIHIHGTADRLLPARFIKSYIPVQGGGHLMVFNRADEINKLLKGILA